MKQLFGVVLFSIVLFSCQQTDLEYSCDPVINKFVIENKAEFSQISVAQLTTSEPALQKAVFRSWTAEKKRDAWIEKLHEVICTNSFSTAESDHIQKLIDHLEVGYFLDENIKNSHISRAKFANEWLNYAANDLGWSGQFIAFLVYRLYTNHSQFDAELSTLNSDHNEDTVNPGPGSCNCNTASDFCSGPSCHSNGCSTGSGCGWLWSSPCDGNC